MACSRYTLHSDILLFNFLHFFPFAASVLIDFSYMASKLVDGSHKSYQPKRTWFGGKSNSRLMPIHGSRLYCCASFLVSKKPTVYDLYCLQLWMQCIWRCPELNCSCGSTCGLYMTWEVPSMAGKAFESFG